MPANHGLVAALFTILVAALAAHMDLIFLTSIVRLIYSAVWIIYVFGAAFIGRLGLLSAFIS